MASSAFDPPSGSASSTEADPDATGAADEAAPRRAPVPPIAKGIAVILIGLLALHVTFTVLWNMPRNEVRNDLRPAVADYMLPFFDQNWGLFAPDPTNSNEHVQVRARVRDDTGEIGVTDWFDATTYEISRIRHHPIPSRAARPSTTFYRRIVGTLGGLSSDQRTVLLNDYSDGDWDRFADDLSVAASGANGTVDAQIRLERMIAAYATGVARAVWGDHVVAVQIRLQGEDIVRFNQRHDDDAQSTFRHTDFGWRPTWRMTDQDQSVFDDFFAEVEVEVEP